MMRIRPLCHLSVRRMTATHDNRFAFGRKFSPFPAKCQELVTSDSLRRLERQLRIC